MERCNGEGEGPSPKDDSRETTSNHARCHCASITTLVRNVSVTSGLMPGEKQPTPNSSAMVPVSCWLNNRCFGQPVSFNFVCTSLV